MKFELPAPVHEGNKWSAMVLGSVVFLAGYLIPNHYHLHEPIYLTMSSVDQAVPLVPWTIFIYQSEYIYLWLAYILIRKDDTRNRLLYSFFAVQIVSMVFFIFWPTTFPRHEYPLPADVNQWIRQAFTALHTIDDPSNSFPSLHVSACFTIAFCFYRESKKKFLALTLWSAAILISTMTTKQHYFVDAVAGLALAMASSWIFVFKARYRALGARAAQLNTGSSAF